MKKLISILAALSLLLCSAIAEQTAAVSADSVPSPEAFMQVDDTAAAQSSVTISFKGNATTGYEWNAVIVGGEAVEIDEAASGYVPDAVDKGLAGAGGIHYFQLKAVKPGQSVIRFDYARSWEKKAIEETVLLFTVDDKLAISTRDITEKGVLNALVVEVNEKEHTAVILSGKEFKTTAAFGTDLKLPAKDEQIVIYTNGDDHVIAWEYLSAKLGMEDIQLPAYVYTGDDPIEEAVAYETIRIAETYPLQSNTVEIPAPVILKVEKTDENHAKVYGEFWRYTYTVIGDVLIEFSGGNYPGFMELSSKDGQWKVDKVEIAGDGEDLTQNIAAFCNGDKELENSFFNEALTEATHFRFISEYVKAHQLPITAYQAPFWPAVSLLDN